MLSKLGVGLIIMAACILYFTLKPSEELSSQELLKVFTVGNTEHFTVLLETHGLPEVQRYLQKPVLIELQEPWVKNSLGLTEVAVRYGADVNADYYGDTALMMAAMWSRVDDVRFLLKQGADPNKLSSDGKMAVDFILGDELELSELLQ